MLFLGGVRQKENFGGTVSPKHPFQTGFIITSGLTLRNEAIFLFWRILYAVLIVKHGGFLYAL